MLFQKYIFKTWYLPLHECLDAELEGFLLMLFVVQLSSLQVFDVKLPGTDLKGQLSKGKA